MDRAPPALVPDAETRALERPGEDKDALRLVAAGMVECRTHPTDRRIRVVRLTVAGRRSFVEMAERHAAWIAALFAGLGDEYMRDMMRLLGRMKQDVRGAVAGTSARKSEMASRRPC